MNVFSSRKSGDFETFADFVLDGEVFNVRDQLPDFEEELQETAIRTKIPGYRVSVKGTLKRGVSGQHILSADISREGEDAERYVGYGQDGNAIVMENETVMYRQHEGAQSCVTLVQNGRKPPSAKCEILFEPSSLKMAESEESRGDSLSEKKVPRKGFKRTKRSKEVKRTKTANNNRVQNYVQSGRRCIIMCPGERRRSSPELHKQNVESPKEPVCVGHPYLPASASFLIAPPPHLTSCPRYDYEKGLGNKYMEYGTIERTPAFPNYPEDDRASDTSTPEPEDVAFKHWLLLITILTVVAATTMAVAVPLAISRNGLDSSDIRLAAARRFLLEVPLVDGHNDLPWNLKRYALNQLHQLNLTSLLDSSNWMNSSWSHTDIERLKRGRVSGQFWSAYVPCDAKHRDMATLILEQIDVIKRMIVTHSQHLMLASSPKDIKLAHRQGKIACLIGVEGGHIIGNSLSLLRIYYDLGARYLTLTHHCDTPWADSSITSQHQLGKGLTSFGEKVIQEMNRLGMIVDLSHVSIQTMRDSLAVTQAPVIFSHASVSSICNHSSNVPDEILQQLALNRGLLMVSFSSETLTCSSSATVKDVVNHINHVRQVAGVDHVGIGSSYDGFNSTPSGLEDASKFPALFAELLKEKRWGERELRKLASGNLIRVMKEVKEVSNKLMEEGVLPVEDVLPRESLRCKRKKKKKRAKPAI